MSTATASSSLAPSIHHTTTTTTTTIPPIASATFPLIVSTIAVMAIVAHVGHRSESHELNRGRFLRIVLCVFLVFLTVCYFSGTLEVFRAVREIAAAETTTLRSASGIAKFCRDLQSLAQEHFTQIILFITSVYMLLQTFCIPGTVVLNSAVGAVMGTLLGVPYCTMLGTLGASSCYLLSLAVGTQLVEAADMRLMKGKGLPTIRAQVKKNRSDLFIYLLFLRLTPILPNWLINLSSPLVGVPLKVFAAATCLGIIPQTYLTVRFGALARNNAGAKSIVTPWDTLLIAVIGVAVLVAFRLKRRFDPSEKKAGGEGSVRETESREVI